MLRIKIVKLTIQYFFRQKKRFRMKMWEQYPFCNLNCFWHIVRHITNGSVQKCATHHEPAATSQWYPPHSCLTESEAARLHLGLIGSLNARLPWHTPIACDGFITLGLWLSVSIRSRLSSLTSHLRYVKPEMLSLALSRSSRISGLVRLTAPPSETT